jgi:hypothetical protein
MRPWLGALALAIGAFGGCNCGSGAGNGPDGGCADCTDGTVCRYDTCVPTPTPCTSNLDCPGDQYCDLPAMECIPWGVGPGGDSDASCMREPVPGVFFPLQQCEWLEPPVGDAFPQHRNVLGTPMVGTFYGATPSIVFTSYNNTDGGAEACEGTDPQFFGVIRVIDGRTCAQQATIASPTVVATASVAIADLGGDATPEIVAARSDGGLVAFTLRPSGWEVLWQTASRFADNLCDWAGPSIHDLDDDGVPEIIFYGAVYDAAGNTIDESIAGSVDSVGTGYVPIVADVDGDGVVELVTGSQLFSWDKTARKWQPKKALPGANGHTAVADFGTFPANGQDVRGQLDGIAELVVVIGGVAKIFTVDGREVFSANLVALGGGPVGTGGPPTVGDFDGDGRVEFATAGASAYHVFDPDCRGTPSSATCPSLRTDGIAWVQRSQDVSSNTTGSAVFDFDGDGRAEAVYGDECFTRIYDGATGKVLYSHFRTSCTFYENPVIADSDGDFNAELVTTSNPNCGVTCPAVDPIFDGLQCKDTPDCPLHSTCGRDQPGDALGRCRCAVDDDCVGADAGYACLDPIGGPSPAGKVCRASHPAPTAVAATGVHVLADVRDHWVNTRPIWNQHAFAVTNIDDAGKVPSTSRWVANWKQQRLNNFRQSSLDPSASPLAAADLTIRQAKVTCDGPAGPTVTAEVCNRGSEGVGRDIQLSGYAVEPPDELKCAAPTTEPILPGACVTVTCFWTGTLGDGVLVVDDDGNGVGRGAAVECREDNNKLAITVQCP